MDLVQLLRTFGALGTVLGLLAGALWMVKRYDIKMPGRVSTGSKRRLEMIEKLAIDSRRSVALIRRDGREHLILLAPEGPLMIEAGIAHQPAPVTVAPQPPAPVGPPAPTPVVDLRAAFTIVLQALRNAWRRNRAFAGEPATPAGRTSAASTGAAEAGDFRQALAAVEQSRRVGDAQQHGGEAVSQGEPAHA